jgi:hypothetical protein
MRRVLGGPNSPRVNRNEKPLLAVTLALVSVQAGDSSEPFADAAFFRLAVWLQDPANAPQYKDIGINLYVGLWKGPMEQLLAELKKHGLRVIYGQNAVGLRHKDSPIILGRMCWP